MTKKRIFLLASAALFTVATVGVIAMRHDTFGPKSPIPKAITTGVTFSLYYPSVLPQGYMLDKNSFVNNAGVVFFDFSKGANIIHISEQALPSPAPDLKNLENVLNFKQINAAAGTAVVGSNNGQPAAILLTNTTLISANGSKDTPSDALGDLMKSLHSL